jgi:hypothetical protein
MIYMLICVAHDTFIAMEAKTMTIRYVARILLALLVATALGCGGGGGGSGGGGGGVTTQPPANPTKATLTLSIPSLPANTMVGGVQFVITLPQGVSPAIFSGNDVSGSITLTGGGTNLQDLTTNYNSTNNTIKFAGPSTSGLGTGNFLILNCVIASGTTVTATDFSISNILVIDSNGTSIPSATISMAVQLS